MFTDALLQHAIALAAHGWCVLSGQNREKKSPLTSLPRLAVCDTIGDE
jgi:hypothetical protein